MSVEADDQGVWCKCGAHMTAMQGWRFPGRRKWLWWSCKACGASSKDAMPLPLTKNDRQPAL